METQQVLDTIALNLLPGLGPVLTRRCLERFGTPHEVAFRAGGEALATIPGMRPEVVRAVLDARAGLRRRAEQELRSAQGMGLTMIPHGSPGYPAALDEIPDPPSLLYVRGELPPATVRVAIVGSRRATSYGRRIAVGLAAGLAERGIEIVSGGARGIDTSAHLGALENSGRTIAILGSGFRRLYPPENAELFDRIAAQGAVVSEFALEMAPLPEHFPRRNRLISGLSAAVVVVEAADRSGSLTTAGHALEQGREVLAVPGPVSAEQTVGTHRLIQQGAKLVHRLQDILDELPPMYASAVVSPTERTPSAAPRAHDLTADEAEILGLFEEAEPLHLDALCDRSPLGIARVQVALFGLAARGLVEQLPGRYYLSALPREA